MPNPPGRPRKRPEGAPRTYIKASNVYLGDTETRKARESKLDVIARRFAKNRSSLIQAIADGELEVVMPKIKKDQTDGE